MLTTLKRWIQSTIGVSSKEANAFIILLPGLFLVIFSQPFYRWLWVGNEPLTIQESVLMDSLIAKNNHDKILRKDSIQFHTFNPNLASVEELISVGITKAVAKRIEQYRVKGGKFRVKTDLKKMYGMDSLLFLTLAPYVDLPEKLVNSTRASDLKVPSRIIEFDLNKADTADFKSIKGIGPVLANRILNHRKSLGGFVSRTQLNEVYGLDSLVLSELQAFQVASDFVPIQLKVNELNEQELEKHPYLSLKQAKAILTYKVQHGKFSTIDDLKNVRLLDARLIQKIEPYISFE